MIYIGSFCIYGFRIQGPAARQPSRMQVVSHCHLQ